MSRIFDPKPLQVRTGPGDTVGKFRSGHQVNGKPASLSEWRVTSDEKAVLEAVAKLLGQDGDIAEWETKADDNQELFTTSSEVEILISTESGGDDQPIKALDARGLIWPKGAKKLFLCSGEAYDVDPEKPNSPIECTYGSYSNRTEFEEEGHVCQPRVVLRFKLADAPDLGEFEFSSGAWGLLTVVGSVIYDLMQVEGDQARATLKLEPVEFTKAGKLVSYVKPVIKVAGSADEA